MSIFNVGTGREPAEIGVAEYQKPDYQHFEKLANVNMQLKQAELEKAQKKTKEWGDILNTDFSTKYAVEQSQYVQKNIQAIKDDLMKDISKNPDLLNDPTTIMQVKARLNQVKGYVKTLDEQAENIIKQKSEFEKDTKGIAYDKQYGKEYFEAQDNPVEFYKNNPDSEVGKKLGVIINSPEIQAITDPDQKRFAIRASIQKLPMKRGTIATDTTPSLTLKFDDVDAKSKDGTSSGYSEVSRPNRISSLMGHVVGKSDPTANKTYVEIWKDKIEHKTDGNYNQYLEQVRNDYANDIAEMTKDYTGKDEQLEMIKKMPDPATATEEDLIRYDYARNYETQFRSRQERASSPKINVYNNPGGKTNDFNANSTSNQVHTIPSVGNTRALQTSLTYTGSGASGINFSFPVAMGTDAKGNIYMNTSGGGANSYSANINDTRQELTYSWKDKFIPLGGGRKIEKPLSEAEINKIEADAAKGIYNPNVVGKVAFVAKGKGSVGSESYNIYTYADEAPEAFDKYNEYLRQAGGNKFIPDKKEYSLRETYDLMQQYGTSKSTPPKAIKRTKKIK